jgi:C-terminal binding protein
MSQIAITDYFDQPSEEEREILGDLVSACPTPETEVLLVWHDQINEDYVQDFPKLRGVQRYGVGFDNLDLDFLKSRGIICANNPDYGVDEVSDTAMAFIMDISRGISRYNHLAKSFRDTWQENVLTHIRRNSDVLIGVVGAGRIGSSVLLKSKAIGFKTIFFDPYQPSGHEKVLGCSRVDSLKELLNKADIVSVHCPLDKNTHGMINADFVSQMKQGASLVNTARGQLMADTDAIYEALKSDHLNSAALDVLPHEPPLDDQLITAWRNNEDWLNGRFWINPHTAYYSHDALSDMRRTAAKNALRILDNQSPKNRL